MRVTDYVAKYILELINEKHGSAEICRNELAGTLGCVPSQISYVITSRFTPEQGYLVESRRGGGGYIRITRVEGNSAVITMHIVNCIGASLDGTTAGIMIKNMVENKILNLQSARLMAAATSSQAMAAIPQEYRGAMRAAIFKNMLMAAHTAN